MIYLAIFVVWLIGFVATHVWLFTDLVKNGQARNLFDFQVWIDDSGTWLVPVMWFAFWPSFLLAR